MLRLECLEDRVTPTNVSATISGTTLVIAKTATGDDSLTVKVASFQKLTLSTTAGNTINGVPGPFTTSKAITSIQVKLGTGNDILTFDGVTNGAIDLTGALNISGTGGNKTITAQGLNLLQGAGLSLSLAGNGTETSTFTDVNVQGPATVNHLGTGTTNFTITTSGSPNVLNNWTSLTINNGIGSDTNTISDTNFAGSITINNGAGDGTTNQFGGSFTNISATNNHNLTTIGGSVVITTASGQSDSELYDYNVRGNVTMSTGAGIHGQTHPNFVGVENIQSFAGSGVPIIGGNVTINGQLPDIGPAQNLVIDLGTGVTPANLPLIIDGNLKIGVTGPGSAAVNVNDQTIAGTTSINLGNKTSNVTVAVQAPSGGTSFFGGGLNITSGATGDNTFSIQNQAATIIFGGPVNLSLAGGNDTVQLGTSGASVNIAGGLSISGTGGSKALSAQSMTLRGSLSLSLNGNGSEDSTFIDVNVGGATTVTHPGTGNTVFTITTSGSPNVLNNWGSLSITNGVGSDTNTINDTDFAGNVTINNGPGDGTTGHFGGSSTTISAANNHALTTIGGNLVITTSTGQSDTEVHDYNILGGVTINAGAGVTGQTFANLVGLENKQTSAGSGIPVIGGTVNVTGGTVLGLTPGLIVDMGTGTGTAPANLPLIIAGGLNITAGGHGSVSIDLNDQRVYGFADIELGAQTSGDTLAIQGSTVRSEFGALLVHSQAGGNNTFNIQDQAGNLVFDSAVVFLLGPGADKVNLAADSTNSMGVTNAVVDFYSVVLFNGDGGANTLFKGKTNTNLFFAFTPVFTHLP